MELSREATPQTLGTPVFGLLARSEHELRRAFEAIVRRYREINDGGAFELVLAPAVAERVPDEG